MLTFKVDARDLIAVRATYDRIEKNAPQALSRALNWVGDKARTQASRALARETGLSYGKVRQELRTKRASQNDLLYAIGVSGQAISLSEFKARQTKHGVSAAPWAHRRVFPGTFIVEKLSGQVFKRIGPERLPIKKLFGPSLPKELVRDVVPKAWEETASKEFAPRVLHELDRLFPQQQGQTNGQS